MNNIAAEKCGAGEKMYQTANRQMGIRRAVGEPVLAGSWQKPVSGGGPTRPQENKQNKNGYFEPFTAHLVIAWCAKRAYSGCQEKDKHEGQEYG